MYDIESQAKLNKLVDLNYADLLGRAAAEEIALSKGKSEKERYWRAAYEADIKAAASYKNAGLIEKAKKFYAFAAKAAQSLSCTIRSEELFWLQRALECYERAEDLSSAAKVAAVLAKIDKENNIVWLEKCFNYDIETKNLQGAAEIAYELAISNVILGKKASSIMWLDECVHLNNKLADEFEKGSAQDLELAAKFYLRAANVAWWLSYFSGNREWAVKSYGFLKSAINNKPELNLEAKLCLMNAKTAQKLYFKSNEVYWLQEAIKFCDEAIDKFSEKKENDEVLESAKGIKTSLLLGLFFSELEKYRGLKL